MDVLLKAVWDLIIVGSVLYVIRKWVGEKLYNTLSRSDRRMAIWNHYISLGKGDTAHSGEVLDCTDRKCVSL